MAKRDLLKDRSKFNQNSKNSTTRRFQNKNNTKGKFQVQNKNNNIRRNKAQSSRRKDTKSKPKTLKHSKRDNPKPKKEKTFQQTEEQIHYIETENRIFKDNDDFYYVGNQDQLVQEEDWEENDDKMVNLHQLISDKLNEQENPLFDKKTIDGFKDLGDILHRWTSGKLPKLFGILPSIEEWKVLIEYTRPMEWTPNAMYEGTCMFASNLNNTLVEDFYKFYLVPYIRNNIRRYGKLNVHLYNSLKKTIYKPAGFFKGIIFQMAENLTAKEANIIGSILSKCSIPVAHSSSAIMILFEKNGLDRISHGHFFFIRILLSKKYALPSPVKEGIVKHLVKISDCSMNKFKLPVIFHQVLLTFVQIYKFDLTNTEKDEIKKLTSKFSHHIITELILKEINFKK